MNALKALGTVLGKTAQKNILGGISTGCVQKGEEGCDNAANKCCDGRACISGTCANK